MFPLQYLDALGTGTWQLLATLTGNGATLSVTNKNVSASSRFYRVQTE